MTQQIGVNAYSEKWLRQGFPWVYPKEITRGRARPGDEVVVRGASEVLGRGLFDDGWIAVRMLRADDGPLDDAWLFATLDRAAALRDAVIDAATTGYRLVHGENDGLPGVRIDWWGHAAVVVLDTPAMAPLLPGIVRWLDRRQPRAVFLCYRPDPREERALVPNPPPGLIAGHPLTGPIRVTERGLGFLVRPDEGPDVGLYADMRDVRAWLEPHWGGRSVLNTFAYTGAFSVSAAFNGACDVTSVDLSSKVLDRAEDNFRANELDPAGHEFIAEDTFKALDRLRRKDRRFDAIVLDPPSFSRGPEGTWSAQRDWPRLVGAAARVLATDGTLIVASNQGELSPKAFRGLIADGLKRVGRPAQELWEGSQAADHPAALWFPEGRYLKVFVYRVW